MAWLIDVLIGVAAAGGAWMVVHPLTALSVGVAVGIIVNCVRRFQGNDPIEARDLRTAGVFIVMAFTLRMGVAWPLEGATAALRGALFTTLGAVVGCAVVLLLGVKKRMLASQRKGKGRVSKYDQSKTDHDRIGSGGRNGCRCCPGPGSPTETTTYRDCD